MEAILLDGGLGTRLRPLTDHLPKPRLPVAGVPLVVHQIVRAREAGVGHIVLATSYRADVFADELGDGSRLVCASITRSRTSRWAPAGRSATLPQPSPPPPTSRC